MIIDVAYRRRTPCTIKPSKVKMRGREVSLVDRLPLCIHVRPSCVGEQIDIISRGLGVPRFEWNLRLLG